MSAMVKIWATKYALSDGISCHQADLDEDGFAYVKRSDRWGNEHTNYYYGEGKDWHRTPEAALARAEEMRTAKIASLEKQIAKLRKLTFTVPE